MKGNRPEKETIGESHGNTLKWVLEVAKVTREDHGSNRPGANSLLQACVDGYFIAPAAIPNYLANQAMAGPHDVKHPGFTDAEESTRRHLQRLQKNADTTPTDDLQKALGRVLYGKCGLSRSRNGNQ